MKISTGAVVTLSYDISTGEGQIVESSSLSGPVTFIAGKSGLIPGLDKRIVGMAEDDEATFDIPPEEAFGTIDEAPIKTIPRAEFPASGEIKVGLSFEAQMPGGQAITLSVVGANDEEVLARMVHPLAGKTISVSVKVVGVREATRAERQQGAVISSPPPPPRK